MERCLVSLPPNFSAALRLLAYPTGLEGVPVANDAFFFAKRRMGRNPGGFAKFKGARAKPNPLGTGQGVLHPGGI